MQGGKQFAYGATGLIASVGLTRLNYLATICADRRISAQELLPSNEIIEPR